MASANRQALVDMLDSLTGTQAQNLINRCNAVAAKANYGTANLANLNDLLAAVKQLAADTATVAKYAAAVVLTDRGQDVAPPQ
jgi:hypothetical protein